MARKSKDKYSTPPQHPDFLYHATPEENVESILKDGLEPRDGIFVHLSQRPESWDVYGLTVLKIDARKMPEKFTVEDVVSDTISYEGKIAACRIRRYNPYPKKSDCRYLRRRNGNLEAI